MIKNVFTFLCCTIVFVSLAFSDEGMWMPTQVGKLPWTELRKRGLELSVDQIYSETIPSAKDGVALIGDGSGAFVSANGLLLTNYHVVVSALQTISSAQQNYLKTGFTARYQQEEIPLQGLTVQVLLSMKDVTTEMYSVVKQTMTDEERLNALKQRAVELETKAKGKTDNECKVANTFFGVKYYLYTYETLRDIRLVLSPPQTIGAFGREEDNWSWPRHTGDFAFLRAYVAPDGKHTTYSGNNLPYKPRMFFPMSAKGYDEGTFVMIMGYPGLTLRHLASPGIQAAQDVTLPYLLELTQAQLDIIRKATEESPVSAVIYASKLQTLGNTEKYIRGTLRAIGKKDVVNIRQGEEIELWDFIFADSIRQEKYGRVMIDLDSAYTEYRAYSQKQIAMAQIINIVQLFRIASVFKDYANSFRDGDQPNPVYKNNLKNFYFSTLKNTDLDVDKQLFSTLMLKASALQDEQTVTSIKAIYGDKKYKEKDEAIKNFISMLWDSTLLSTTEECDLLLERKPSEIKEENFVKFVIAFDAENKAVQAKLATIDAKITALLKKYSEAKLLWKGGDPYPDANKTLRITYGDVKSYKPRNSVFYDYFTTSAGLLEKSSVYEDDFLTPTKLFRLLTDRNFGSYMDSSKGDLPINFITSTDISGGNSGSPVLNGKGELLGVSFDGNWEGMAGDYYYQPELNRTVCVDNRYILFYLEKFVEAQNILSELSIKK